MHTDWAYWAVLGRGWRVLSRDWARHIVRRFALIGIAGIALSTTAGCAGDDENGGIQAGNPFGNAMPQAGDDGYTGLNPDGSEGTIEGYCPEGLARTSRVVPRVVLVLDGSCSMSTEYGAGGPSATVCTSSQTSRWGALRSALLDPNTGVVSRLHQVVEFGLVIFGTQPSCPIPGNPINPVVNNLDAISNAFPNTPPGLYTPTGPALQWVYENMLTGQTLDSNRGPEIVILATDGEPNSCNDATTNYDPSVTAAMYGQSLGATTYVISLANSTGEFHDHLQQMADIGSATAGAPLYEPTNPEELAAALELLIGGAVGCDLALNGVVEEGEECSASVTLNGRSLSCGSDWVLSDPRHIRLREPVCTEFQNSPSAQLEADFPCEVFHVD